MPFTFKTNNISDVFMVQAGLIHTYLQHIAGINQYAVLL